MGSISKTGSLAGKGAKVPVKAPKPDLPKAGAGKPRSAGKINVGVFKAGNDRVEHPAGGGSAGGAAIPPVSLPPPRPPRRGNGGGGGLGG